MNGIAEQIKRTINSKTEIKKAKKNDKEGRRNFSWSAFFAGEEYNQELAKNSEIKENNIIDFTNGSQQQKELVENKIKEIFNSATNKKIIEEGKFPIIWFKNIDKIADKSPLQKFLLAIFDPAQNNALSIKGEIIDLTPFVLIATSSTHDTSQLSSPLFSRLDCINVDTAQPKKFFWDKYFYPILTISLLTFLILILLLIFYSDRKKNKIK
ncbi:MAG: AAA family ATPase [Candidatus Moeniiplasma glomeromycotorum]|nr:AAA family ATPase [Candidatus Moeniiplasma glomeromycotorum]MCE8169478.1 AAA family ATPase [Candidatus Moeniiplasma glomeromycotorum]